MTTNMVWFITGAGRGMGVEFARAALGAGHSVVATGRNIEIVRKAIGEHDELLVAKLDITDPANAKRVVEAAAERFGRIDVLVNNAGNVTRAILPVMRRQRSGLVVTLSSLAGLVGQEFCSAYAASKFGLEGWMEPPLRWVAGADTLPTAEKKARDLLAQIEAHRTLSESLAHDALPATGQWTR